MIVVDTSVWVDFFRGRAPNTELLSDLLDDDQVALPIPVRVELLSGARRTERPRLRRVLSALPVLYPTDASWTRIEQWITDGAAAGHRFGAADLLIASLSTEHGHALWSLDADFKRMARLNMLRLATPR